MSIIGPLSAAKGRKIEILQNKHGSADFTYPLDGIFSEYIKPYKTGILAERFNWRATRVFNNLGNFGQIWDPVWSGYVLPINEDLAPNKMSVSCIGWTQRLAKRLTRNSNMHWSGIDDAIIIRDLIQHLNGLEVSEVEHDSGINTYQYLNPPGDNYEITWPLGSSPNTPNWISWGGVQPDEGPGGDTEYISALRNFKAEKYAYGWPYIENLMNIENGCDIHLNPLSRILTAHRRYRRATNNVIAFATGPHNASSFSRQADADKIVNYFLAQGDSSVPLQYADDIDSQLEIGPIEEIQQLAGVNDAGVLLAYAGAEIITRKDGVITYGVTPFSYRPGSSVPEPLVDYRQGDQVLLSAKYLPRINIDKVSARVFGLNFSIDDETGNEQLQQLQINP